MPAANKFLEKLNKGQINLTTADVRALLVKSSFVFDPDVQTIDNGGSNCAKFHELTASGYSRQTLTTLAVTRDDTNNWAAFTFDDVTFGAPVAGETVGGMMIYVFNASDLLAEVIGFFDFADIPTGSYSIIARCPASSAGGAIKTIGI